MFCNGSGGVINLRSTKCAIAKVADVAASELSTCHDLPNSTMLRSIRSSAFDLMKLLVVSGQAGWKLRKPRKDQRTYRHFLSGPYREINIFDQ